MSGTIITTEDYVLDQDDYLNTNYFNLNQSSAVALSSSDASVAGAGRVLLEQDASSDLQAQSSSVSGTSERVITASVALHA